MLYEYKPLTRTVITILFGEEITPSIAPLLSIFLSLLLPSPPGSLLSSGHPEVLGMFLESL